ncbi:aspartate carbamoyltransferase [Bacteroidales bacterium OttesenSCG-928-B11]|nr:aspartate carbamoyltransferase [Bacteroidales bacterium OttesenSCG-928-C03]MDL2312273.1 aspartate carbamoyltransferase [Bacteroidales bacterium OttesenSCG-928-B11]
MLKGRSLIDPSDFTREEFREIFDLAHQIIENPEKFNKSCEGKILATLFYEPSTRTRFSFEAAMLRLGGTFIGFSEPNSSSTAKGENIADTIRTIECYADIAVMRHPKEGAPKVADQYITMPLINAGDGGHQHPTQTLTDILTIERLKGGVENKTYGFCGDLKFGRTVHSLIKFLSNYEGVKFILISPEELRVPEYIREEIIKKKNIPFEEVEKMEPYMGELDFLYMTRVQKERFFNEEDYVRLKDRFILDNEKMKHAKPDTYILHPLPRVNEISLEVDCDPRAQYFAQAKNGMYVRMALILKLLGLK